MHRVFLFQRPTYKALRGLKMDIPKVQLLIKLSFLDGLIVHLPDEWRRKITIEFRVQIRVVMRKRKIEQCSQHPIARFSSRSVLVFFVTKIEKISAQKGSVGQPRAAVKVPTAALPHCFCFRKNSSPDKPGPSVKAAVFKQNCYGIEIRLLTPGPREAEFSDQAYAFLPGTSPRVESDVTYRKHRESYNSARSQNSMFGSSLACFLASHRLGRRFSLESPPREDQRSCALITTPVSESHHV